MRNNSFDVKFSALKGAPNIIYLNDDATNITEEEFEEDLKSGYRAALLIMPVTNAIQVQVGMMTPYHKDQYQIDPTFVVENYNSYLHNIKADDVKLGDDDEFYIGEIENA